MLRPESPQEQPTLADAEMAEATIREALEKANFPVGDSVDYCVRPTRELRVLEAQLRRTPTWQKPVWQRDAIRTDVIFGSTNEAKALYYASAHPLTYRSHRFTFNNGGEIAYHQESFNTDPQCIPGRALNLTGLEEITGNPSAIRELQQLAEYLKDTTELDWQPRVGRLAIKAC